MKNGFRNCGVCELEWGEGVVWGEKPLAELWNPDFLRLDGEQKEVSEGNWEGDCREDERTQETRCPRGQGASLSGMSSQPSALNGCWLHSLHRHAAAHLHVVSSKQVPPSHFISSLRILWCIFTIFTVTSTPPNPRPLSYPHNLLFSLGLLKLVRCRKLPMLSWVCGFPQECRPFSLRLRLFSSLARSPL